MGALASVINFSYSVVRLLNPISAVCAGVCERHICLSFVSDEPRELLRRS